jgi:hypothetical protein
MEFIRVVLWNDLNSIDKCGVDYVYRTVLHIGSKNRNDFVCIQIDPQVYALFYISYKLQRKLRGVELKTSLRYLCQEFLRSFIYIGELKVFMQHSISGCDRFTDRLPLMGTGGQEMGFPLGLQRVLYQSTLTNGLIRYSDVMNSNIDEYFYYVRYNELLVIQYKF